MAGKYVGRIPREGERVMTPKTQGMYSIVKLHPILQTADVRLTNGSGPVISDIPWNLLTFVDNKY
jgi:hypothetical protein